MTHEVGQDWDGVPVRQENLLHHFNPSWANKGLTWTLDSQTSGQLVWASVGLWSQRAAPDRSNCSNLRVPNLVVVEKLGTHGTTKRGHFWYWIDQFWNRMVLPKLAISWLEAPTYCRYSRGIFCTFASLSSYSPKVFGVAREQPCLSVDWQEAAMGWLETEEARLRPDFFDAIWLVGDPHLWSNQE